MEKEFTEALSKLSELYEQGKSCLHNIPRPVRFDEAQSYDRLYNVLKDMRDLAATTMQKLHWKNPN